MVGGVVSHGGSIYCFLKKLKLTGVRKANADSDIMVAMNRVYVVIDCNNFFVSCERLFRPDLDKKPVIVLSNNDGCAVSRSNEAKPFIPMGAPLFKYESIIEAKKITYFSANFRLYGDISQRIMSILEQYAPYIEQYSVDEAFLEIGSLSINDYLEWGRKLRSHVLQWTGIPVSVGIAPTKTLAKAAVERAKKDESSRGVLSFMGNKIRTQHMKVLPVEDVWGVGRRLAPRLHGYGIRSAHDLSRVDSNWIQQITSVVSARMVKELQGIDCFGLDITYNQPSKHTIAATRTFGKRVTAQFELEQAIASFSARAAHKLRRQHQLASEVSIFATTGKHSSMQRTIKARLPFDTATADTGFITEKAIEALTQVYDQDFAYKRAGIMLTGLVPEYAQQLSLSQPQPNFQQREELMRVMDQVNQKWGGHTLNMAAEGVGGSWHSKREHTSKQYTTNWEQLPKVKA